MVSVEYLDVAKIPESKNVCVSLDSMIDTSIKHNSFFKP